MLLRAGKLPEDFIEGMACEGGCVNGPGAIAYGPAVMKARETSLAQGDKRGVYENLQQFEVGSQDNMTLEKLTHPKHPRKFEQ
jgi:ferredoxin hydrogenase large subunit